MTALYLSVKDAAALMGCSVTTVKRGIAAGTIPAIRPGGPTSWARVPRACSDDGGDDRIRTDA